MNTALYDSIHALKQAGKKALAVLIDPDNITPEACEKLVLEAVNHKVGYIFVGGSLITGENLPTVIKIVKANSNIPVIIFPGNNLHIDASADGILFLSLISGRNPEHLIGQHVLAAPIIKRTALQVLPTGYILIDGGAQTTVSYISNTTPIPADKPGIAACTAMAGEMLGMKLIYLDAGSGAKQQISAKLVTTVRKAVNAPLIVGGGIDSPFKLLETIEAGADIVVVGNVFEKDPSLLTIMAKVVNNFNEKIN